MMILFQRANFTMQKSAIKLGHDDSDTCEQFVVFLSSPNLTLDQSDLPPSAP